MQPLQNWREVNGDETLALDWPLDENSHVWEIGGYEGRWAQQIWDKFHCNITIFEPQTWAVERMTARFAGIDKIEIRPYGLWMMDCIMPIGNYETDGASVVNIVDGKPVGMGEFRNFQAQMVDFIPTIDLCLMNIEGAEFRLLPLFQASGTINLLDNFWCQFHPRDEKDNRAEGIILEMGKTHDMLWNCFPTAVAWKRR